MTDLNVCNTIFQNIQMLLKDGLLRTAYRVGNAFTRIRKLGFEQLFLYLLNASRSSICINMEDLIEKYPEVAFPDISKQALSKARQGIAPEAFAELLRITVMEYYKNTKSLRTWNDFHVYAIDGTSLQIPQTTENMSVFGKAVNQTGSGCALASASICFDVLNDMVTDAIITSYCYGERKLALMHTQQMKCYGFQPKTLFLFDRGYPSYNIYQNYQDQGLFFLIRLDSRTHQSIQEEGVFQYEPKEHKGHPLSLRMVYVILDDGTVERLVTNIFDQRITSSMFKELYFLRWGVESKYREFKNRLEIEEFSGYTPISIRQDFFIRVFLSNISSIVKAEADMRLRMETAGNTNKYVYQTNRSFIINRIQTLIVKYVYGLCRIAESLERIVSRAVHCLSQRQPGRSYARKAKRNRQKHRTNQKTCL